jgi:integrase
MQATQQTTAGSGQARRHTRQSATRVRAQRTERGGRIIVLQDAQLAEVLATYYTSYGSSLPGAHVFRAAARDALQIWGDLDVSELGAEEQDRFVATLRDRKLVDWTIQTKVNMIWAAMRWVRRRFNKHLVVPDKIKAQDWKPVLPDRTQTFSRKELAALLDAAGTPGTDGRRAHEHWWRFMVLAIGTASRITALLELTWSQVNLEDGFIALQPDKRPKTKKRRATVSIAPTLAAELARWDRDSERVITRLGHPVYSRGFFAELAQAAQVLGSANVIRHTMRTRMAKAGVPEVQADIWMGHKEEGSPTGRRYKHLAPTYLAQARDATEDTFRELAGMIRHPLGRRARR